MVFGFFSKKPVPTAPIEPENIPLPPSPPSTSSFKLPSSSRAHLQLRTPSPSIESGSVLGGPGPSNSPAPASKDITNTPPNVIDPEHEEHPNPEPLITLIKSIPPKILHAYVLAQLPSQPASSLGALSTFFTDLTPPPKLHCVRCHKDFVEVENDDRSCLVPHDDESAEVERVGLSTISAEGVKRGRPVEGTTFETLWGCCGKTVAGDGDQGPPDGWCYEGKHTTDIRRARFRADSSIQDDKLVSCIRLNCHGIRSQLSSRRRSNSPSKKRSRAPKKNYKEDSESEGVDDDGKRRDRAASVRGNGKGKEKVVEEGEKMEVDDVEDDSASRTGSVRGRGKGRGRGRPRAGSSAAPLSAVIKSSTSAATTPLSKRRGRPPLKDKATPTPGDGVESSTAPPTSTKRRGRQQYKSKATIEDSDEEAKSVAGSISRSPVRMREVPVRTRSQSRTRADATSPARKPLEGKDSIGSVVPETEDEGDVRGRKRRKVNNA
ncbi:hypothetical protein C8Q75DRAFT_791004 [Abortiporus biennis]|nr:hypothetical protein C8Q75DRAFT_791004 [Abortiporus biennis]